jgi:hypothetical protein
MCNFQHAPIAIGIEYIIKYNFIEQVWKTIIELIWSMINLAYWFCDSVLRHYLFYLYKLSDSNASC